MKNPKDVKKAPANPPAKDEKAPGEKKNFLDDVNKGLRDFVGKVFGENGTKFFDDAKDKVEEFSNQSAKKLFEFADSVLDTLKLKDNETVKKTRDQVEDALKKAGILKEEPDEEFF
jgi:gas vesicle protein